MTLNEYMESAEAGKIYCVGSNSGFLFIGPPEEYHRDIGKLSEKLLDTMHETLCKLMRGAKTDNKKKKADTWKKRIDEFTPLKEREIKEVYTTVGGEVVVLIEGKENGDYWTRNEYLGIKKSPVEHEPGSEEAVSENYMNLAKEIVMKAAYSYESGYKRMKEVFGIKEYFPETFSELTDLLKHSHGTVLSKTPGEAMEAFYQARRFFLSPEFAIYSGADPYKIMEHIEALTDKGSSLRLQQYEAEKEWQRRERLAKRKHPEEE